ncbi:MAG: Rrf2 family transcriptional regulator [Desulfobacula sp.]|nr:Rrf2 family transcriptional regulator [Desulfobacula sp.]
MKLVTQVRYGIRILLDLAMHQSRGVIQMRDIAERQNISLKYLEQLIRPFKKAGFVNSKRGRNGGHSLARSPETITLAQIIMVFEKDQAKQDISRLSEGYSQYQDALITEAWNEAKDAFYQRLEKVTLANLSIGTTKKLWQDSDILIL